MINAVSHSLNPKMIQTEQTVTQYSQSAIARNAVTPLTAVSNSEKTTTSSSLVSTQASSQSAQVLTQSTIQASSPTTPTFIAPSTLVAPSKTALVTSSKSEPTALHAPEISPSQIRQMDGASHADKLAFQTLIPTGASLQSAISQTSSENSATYNLKTGAVNVAGLMGASDINHAATVMLKNEKSTEQDPIINPNADTSQSVKSEQAVTSSSQQEPTEQEQSAEKDKLEKQDQVEQAEKEQADQEKVQQQKDEAIIKALAARDLEVKTHEQAHAAVGGNYANSPEYTYEKGPDGKRYAVEGKVNIDVGVIEGDAQATVTKMQKVYAAAMAPVQPSSADLQVAAEATRKLNEAKKELIVERQEKVMSTEETQHINDLGQIFNNVDGDSLNSGLELEQLNSTLSDQSNFQPNPQSERETNTRLSAIDIAV
ncbi:SprA-related family protein [Shewanella sp. P1-14-1]|nr:SprA-related family protein [Shewanella sp. P1-14-1]